MLGLLQKFEQSRYQLDFIIAETDSTSLKRVEAVRPDLTSDLSRFHTVPRSREVGQTWVSTVGSTAKAFFSCLALVWRLRPQVVLVNGPGTCVPVVAAALLFELLVPFRAVTLIFAESICRVESISLTGKLLYAFTDLFVVHWPELAGKYPKAQYLGVLL